MTNLNLGATISDGGGSRFWYNSLPNVNDGNTASNARVDAFVNGSGGATSYTTFLVSDLGSALNVGSMAVTGSFNSADQVPWDVDHSSDGSTWTPVTGLTRSWDGATSTLDFDDVTARYWRLAFYNTETGVHYVSGLFMYEWAIYEGVPPPPPVPRVEVVINGVSFDNVVDVEVRVEENRAGSFMLTLYRGDPQATAANLAPGNIVSITFPEIDPDVILEYFLEDGDFDLVSDDEEGGEVMRFGGPGTLSILKRAVMAAERYDASAVGAVYPKKGRWEFGASATEGAIMNKILNEATHVDRPQQPLPGITWDFTATHDSDGVLWDGTEFEGTWRVQIGSDLYTEFSRMTSANFVAVEMGPGLVLHMYRSRGTDRHSNTFGAGKVIFQRRVNIAEELAKGIQGRDFASHQLERWGDEQQHYAWVHRGGPWPYVQEVFGQSDTTHLTTAQRTAIGELGWREDAQNTILLTHIVPYPGAGPDDDAGLYLPGQDWTENGRYWVGDSVSVHTGLDETDYTHLKARVKAITIRADITGYIAPVVVELNGVYQGQSAVNSGVPGVGGTGATGSGGGGGGSSLPPYLSAAWQPIAEKGEADGYASLDGDALVPIDELGTGGDGSGDNYLADDHTWKPFPEPPDLTPLTDYAWVPVMANDPGIVTTHGQAVYVPWVTSEGEAIMMRRTVT